jgi:glutamine amidotransferase
VSTKVTVIDYGIGNIHSVVKALKFHGADVKVSPDAADIASAERLVLPGVGAFADGMRGLKEPIRDYVKSGRPFMGICLGMQLMLKESEEFGHHEGLGLVPGKVVEIPKTPGIKVPHVGWNRIEPRPEGTWLDTPLSSTLPGAMVYFVHSFTAQPEHEADRLADAWYGGHRIGAAIRRENVVGFQFHPEKSGAAGLAILRRFLQ